MTDLQAEKGCPVDAALPPLAGFYHKWSEREGSLIHRIFSETTLSIFLGLYWLIIAVGLCIPTLEASIYHTILAGISFFFAAIAITSFCQSALCLIPLITLIFYDTIVFSSYLASSVGLMRDQEFNGYAILLQWKGNIFVSLLFSFLLLLFLFKLVLSLFLYALYIAKIHYDEQEDLRNRIGRYNIEKWLEWNIRTREQQRNKSEISETELSGN